MGKTVFIEVKIEPDIKDQAEAVFALLGLTPSQVITMLYSHVSKYREIPLAMDIPNFETLKAINEARAGVGVMKGKDIDNFFTKHGG